MARFIPDGGRAVTGPDLNGLLGPVAKMTLVNLATGERKAMMFNPTELKERWGPTWTKITIPGGSYQPKHFSHVENQSFDFELFFDAHASARRRAELTDTKNFLQSLHYPRRGGGGPPEVLMVWPKVVSMRVTFEPCEVRNTLFFPDGSVAQFYATMKVEEVRNVQLYSDDVRRHGNLRACDGPQGDQ